MRLPRQEKSMTTKTMPSREAPQVERRVRVAVDVQGRTREVEILAIRTPPGWIYMEPNGQPSYLTDTPHGRTFAALAEGTDDGGWQWTQLEVLGSAGIDTETLVSVITTFLGPGKVGLIQWEDAGDWIRFQIRCGR